MKKNYGKYINTVSLKKDHYIFDNGKTYKVITDEIFREWHTNIDKKIYKEFIRILPINKEFTISDTVKIAQNLNVDKDWPLTGKQKNFYAGCMLYVLAALGNCTYQKIGREYKWQR